MSCGPNDVRRVVQPEGRAQALHPLPSAFSRYKKYVFLDPLAGAVTKTHVMLGAETEEKLFDAPLSISRREQLERQVDGDNAWVWGRCGPPVLSGPGV